MSGLTQYASIPDWLPAQVANGSHGHWSTRKRNHDQAKLRAYLAANNAGWKRIAGRAELTIIFVFDVKRRRDIDNLYARAKGVVDGLKKYIHDDSTDWLDLRVQAQIERRKETRLILREIPS